MVDYTWYYNDLLRRNYPYIVMAGQMDAQDGAISQYLWMKKNLNVTKDFWEQDRRIFYYPGDDGMKIGGYYQDNGRFTMLTVPKAGHFVPYFNYDVTAWVLRDFVAGKRLSCHAKDGNCRVTKKMCDYMRLPQSQGTCKANGKFQCVDGFIGADCAT